MLNEKYTFIVILGVENMLWVEYFQTYRSSNFKSNGWKRQLWQLEDDNVWRIVYEGGG